MSLIQAEEYHYGPRYRGAKCALTHPSTGSDVSAACQCLEGVAM
jgi:hypothetical protein